MSITVDIGPGETRTLQLQQLRGIAWVRVSRNGSQLVLGKAHTKHDCQYLQARYVDQQQPIIVPLRGPILKRLCWCQLCLDPVGTTKRKRGKAN